MAERCVCCGQGLPESADPVQLRLAELVAACAREGIDVTFDEHISERDAAFLLDLSPHTLRNRRAMDRPIAFRRRGRRVLYALADIAAYIQEAMCPFETFPMRADE